MRAGTSSASCRRAWCASPSSRSGPRRRRSMPADTGSSAPWLLLGAFRRRVVGQAVVVGTRQLLSRERLVGSDDEGFALRFRDKRRDLTPDHCLQALIDCRNFVAGLVSIKIATRPVLVIDGGDLRHRLGN